MRAGLVVVGCVLLVARISAAEPERTGTGWELYDDAFAALERGDEAQARAMLRQVLGDHAGEPAAVKAAEVIAVLDAGPGVVAERPAPRRDPGGERKTSQARAELAIFQMVNGMTLGMELCLVASCQDAAPVIGLALLGGAAGVGVSIGATHGGALPGARASYNSGVAWGAINALGLTFLADSEGDTVGPALITGQVLGLVSGALVERGRPTAGQVALANTTGMWAGVLAGGLYAASHDSLDDHTTVEVVLASADLGIGIGAILGGRLPHVSRSQTLVIDAGGITGGLAGAGIAVLATGDSNDRVVAGLGVAGAAIGLGLAAYFTREWGHRESAAPRAALMPTPGGAVATLGYDF